MKRVCIQFDECKPHWAEQRGYLDILKDCGLLNDDSIRLTGDFDAKLTYIYGNVSSVELFKARFNRCPLRDEGSVREVLREQD